MNKLAFAIGGALRTQAMIDIQNADKAFDALVIDNESGDIVNNNGTTKYQDFKTIIEDVLRVRRRSLNGIDDLIGAGLVQNGDISQTLFGYEVLSESDDARTDMNPTSYGNDNTEFSEAFAPVPIIHKTYSVPFRQGSFDYKNSMGRDESVRKVGEAAENLLFNGSDIQVNFNGTLVPSYGYLNHPQRGQATISDWTDLATNGSKIVGEVLSMISNIWADNGGVMNDSLVLYVSNDFWIPMEADYSDAKGDRTFKERIMAIAQIKDIKPSESLPAKTVCLVEMERRTIELVVEQDMITVPHLRNGALDPSVWTTFMAVAPLIKVDAKGQVGFVVGTQA